MSATTGASATAAALPFTAIEPDPGSGSVVFQVEGRRYRYLQGSDALADLGPAEATAPTEVLSPDGKWAVFGRDGELCLRNTGTGEERTADRRRRAGRRLRANTDVGGAGLVVCRDGRQSTVRPRSQLACSSTVT